MRQPSKVYHGTICGQIHKGFLPWLRVQARGEDFPPLFLVVSVQPGQMYTNDKKPVSEQLTPCPYLPICVCSRDDAAPRHRVEPFIVSGDTCSAFERLKGLLRATPRSVIATATEDYVHAICRTQLGFVDDVEFRLSPAQGVIHIRSESRLWFAFYDFGANRRRVEALRRRFEGG